jgi:sugar diacid utilization regulator
MEATKTARKKRASETFIISYRVESARLAQLEKGASELGVSLHEYARILLFRVLDQGELSGLQAAQEETRSEVRKLREDMAVSVEMILSNLADEDSQDEIRDWVSQNLRGEI